jgi:putative PEP-CTERM system histidine kinase
MSILLFLQVVSALSSFAISFLALLTRRFGPFSWVLAAFYAPAALSATALASAGRLAEWSDNAGLLAAYCLMVLSAPGGLIFSMVLASGDLAPSVLERWRWHIVFCAAAAPFLVVLIWSATSPEAELGFLASGELVRYLSGVYLLVLSVLVLANLERVLRSAEEHVLWAIKFLILGLAAPFGAYIYLASKVLLYSRVPRETLQMFPSVLFFSCLLVLVSWRRGPRRGKIGISQGFAYSTITFIFVGIYLIASSIVANWAGRILESRFETEVVFLLVAVSVLGLVLLSTTLRHRLRAWIRKNIFAGKYDYRTFWMEASSRLQDSDPPGVAAAALAGIVHRALGALDVTVWLRDKMSGKLRLEAARGPTPPAPGVEVEGVLGKLADLVEPAAASDIGRSVCPGLSPDFLGRTGAVLVVPLRSGAELVGLLTVGRDRSGPPYDGETREFLRVLAGHAAGEFHKAELLIAQVKAKEDEAFRAFSTFLLHDLKNFAYTLSMVAQNAAKHQDNPEFRRDAFRSIVETGEKIKRLCSSLRAFSTRLAANLRPEDLNQVIRGYVASLDAELRARLELELGELPAVIIDAAEVASVLQNLVINADEALGHSGTITVRTERINSSVELSVSDRGPGIPRAFLQSKLFQPFHTTKTNGLGIGLFHAKRIIEAHGGTIQVESEEGRGTTVRARLPLAGEKSGV